VIFYGFGKRCKQLLKNDYFPKPSEIWDINTTENTFNDIKIATPKYNKLINVENLLIVVCVDDFNICEYVIEQAQNVGFTNVTDWCTYLMQILEEKK
jgi:hypothetical protein